MAVRPIDANALLEKLQRMIDYCKNDNQVNGLTALFQIGDAIMDCSTLENVEKKNKYCPNCGARMNKENETGILKNP